MNTWSNNSIMSMPAAENIVAGQFIDFSGAVAKSVKALGVAMVDADAGEFVSVKAIGAVLVQAGGTIAAGDKVVADANGCAIKQTDEEFYEGYATEAAGKGDMFEIIRGI